MFKVAFLLLALTLAYPAMAEDDLDTPNFVEDSSMFSDSYKGSGNLCGSDCARQDRIREIEPRRPYELENSFDNGRQGKSVSGIVSNLLEPSGSR